MNEFPKATSVTLHTQGDRWRCSAFRCCGIERFSLATRVQCFIASLAVLCLAASPKSYSRSRPPSNWDKAEFAVFETNAYVLLDGTRPQIVPEEESRQSGKPDQANETHVEFDRSDMMKQLRSAETALVECLNNERSFSAAASKITSSADLLEMLGRTLFSSDPDYRDDDSYLKQAEDMTAAARRIKAHVVKGDYDGAVRAFGAVKKSCDSCHTLFR